MARWGRLVAGLVVIAVVAGASYLSTRIWGGKPETVEVVEELILEPGMTVGEFGEVHGVSKQGLKRLFGLQGPEDLSRTVESFAMDEATLLVETRKAAALSSEDASKSWIKIYVKFGLWIGFLALVFVLLRRRKVTARLRLGLYGAAVVVFGVVLGADPSPMGTVKDAIGLYAETGAVFLPRMVALAVFLLMVVVGNKLICSWGCQLGTLQDLLFRVGRDKKDKKAVLPQLRLPFWLTNTIRVLFLAAFTLVVVLWAVEIIDPIDPFKVFKPAVLTGIGLAFVGGILVLSLFVYRPWCHLACPFGLVGWLFEKLSVVKIKVDYDACISCEQCAKSCPSSVMGAILRRDTVTIPDCFSCGTCVEVCPTDAVAFGTGRRAKPPEDKFSRP